MIELNTILEDAISRLDISPTDFELARLRYKSVGKWLENGDYSSGDSVGIYLQGSFRLGTVIRPYRNKTDADYDIDQVCEINGEDPSAVELKTDVGNRLKEHSDYSRMLDKEGKRCWTLIYAADSNRPGFHLDVLPARNSSILGLGNKIKITNRGDSNYVWRESNPRGYYEWFKDRNDSLDDFAYSQRKEIFQKNASLYASVEEVPKELVRTPLQRAIQLMKRHRDVSFDGKKGSPISIIITTICAHRYRGRDIDDTIQRFLKYVKDRLEAVVSGEDPEEDGIMDYTNGKWNIPNPTNENENFADRWEADPDRAKAFFAWVYQLGRDYHGFSKSSNPIELRTAARGLSSEAPTASKALIIGLEQKGISSSDDFLALIHSAIDLKTSWEDVTKIAWQNVQQESGASEKDIAYINYYQALRHKGDGLNAEQTEHIKRILDRRGSTPAFVLCCNLLLGSASQNMLKESLRSGWDSNDILSWPIIRLYKGRIQRSSA